MSSPGDWYNSLPPISKLWATGCVAATVGHRFGLLDPKLIYLDYGLIFQKFQIWRLVTNFFFLAPVSMKFVMELLLILRYGVGLESNTYQGRKADFLYMLIFGMGTMLAVSLAIPVSFLSLPFLGSSLAFMVLYIWCRENPNSNVSLYGILNVQAFYLPWVFIVMNMMFGNSMAPDLLGIFVGHVYYYLNTIYPLQGGVFLLQTPSWVHYILDKWGISDRQPVSFTPAQNRTPTPSSSAPTSQSSSFRGRGYRLDRD